MISFNVEDKKVDIYPASGPDKPAVYLNTFGRQGNSAYKALQSMESPDCNLVAVSGANWNHDMTPWDCPPISRFDTPCTGGADDYLQFFTQKIVPETERRIEGTPVWRGISGYSLAGLFAVYALYQTDVFSRVATMSGSLWFPNFKEYVFSHEMKIRPDCVYFSLGDKEAKPKNPFLKSVQDNTDEIQKFYAAQGIDSIFVLNPGNHYANASKRTAAGINWILKK